MNKWILSFLPFLLLLFVVSIDEVHAERLLVTGSGTMEKRVTNTPVTFEFIFNTVVTEKRTLLEFESGSISSRGVENIMMPSTDVRDTADHRILRISGTLDNGDIFWIYGLKDGNTYEMFGMLVTTENIFRLTFDGTIKSLEEPIPDVRTVPQNEADVEYVPKLAISYDARDPTLIQEDFKLDVRAYDANKSEGGLLNNLYVLPGVKVNVILEQPKMEFVVVNERTSFIQIVEGEWVLMDNMSGQTNKFGDYIGSILLPSGVYEPKQFMRVTIEAVLGDQVVTEQFEVWVDQIGHK